MELCLFIRIVMHVPKAYEQKLQRGNQRTRYTKHKQDTRFFSCINLEGMSMEARTVECKYQHTQTDLGFQHALFAERNVLHPMQASCEIEMINYIRLLEGWRPR
jgi:hypothetical protein